MVICNICQSELEDEEKLKIHKECVHKKLIWCDDCDEYFLLESHLENHLNVVHFLRKYVKKWNIQFQRRKLKSVVGPNSLVSWPWTKSLAWNCPNNLATWPSTCKIEPSLKAKTGGTPGISWYWQIRSSLVSPLWVELGS